MICAELKQRKFKEELQEAVQQSQKGKARRIDVSHFEKYADVFRPINRYSANLVQVEE